MKKLFTILIAIAMPLFLLSQETNVSSKPDNYADSPRVREAGLLFQNFDGFGITYRVGKQKALWRFESMFLNAATMEDERDSLVQKNINYSIGFSVGREYRKSIASKFDFKYGFDISFTHAFSESELEDASHNDLSFTQKSYSYVPGVNAVLGFSYSISDQIILGAEMLPGIRYIIRSTKTEHTGSVGRNSESYQTGFTFGFDSNPVLLSLVYQF